MSGWIASQVSDRIFFYLSSSDTKGKNTGSSCLTVDLKDRIEGKRGDEREMWMERKRYKKKPVGKVEPSPPDI